MKPEIERAIEDLRRCFADAEVKATLKDDGSASITVDPIDLGAAYKPQGSWIKFAISFQYPYADIYPLFVRPDLTRADGQPHGKAITSSSYDGESALQLSRSNNHLDPTVDTAALKVLKVIEWLRTR